MLLPSTERPYFTPGFPLWLSLEHEVRISSFDGPATQSAAGGAAPNPIRSDTSQLTWYHSAPGMGLVTVDSPRTQALIGFLRSQEAGDGNLEAEVENKFCSIQLSSLDAKPISQSSRMLLIAGGRVENTGQRWNSAGTDVTNWGDSPTLIEPVVGTLTLRHIEPARTIQLQAIDHRIAEDHRTKPSIADRQRVRPCSRGLREVQHIPRGLCLPGIYSTGPCAPLSDGSGQRCCSCQKASPAHAP